MGQWGRQHEQVNCCFLETVSLHPTWSTQSSGRSRHHSSERRKSIHNAINTSVGAPMEAPPTDATTVGLAVNVLAGPGWILPFCTLIMRGLWGFSFPLPAPPSSTSSTSS